MKASEESQIDSVKVQSDSSNLEVSKDSRSTKNNTRSKDRIWFDELVDGLVNGLLGELLLLLPFGIIAWIFIAWGLVWLIIPLLVVVILVFIWLSRHKS